MLSSKRNWIIAIATALYLYFLMPATAYIFYELYHLTHIEPIYWGYSGFKLADYYLGLYDYRLVFCVSVAAAMVVIPAIARKLRGA